MFKSNLPTYVLVELLIRISSFDNKIGDYKNHTYFDDGVMVKTNQGTIHFPESLVMNQFQTPELITEQALIETAASFKPFQSFNQ